MNNILLSKISKDQSTKLLTFLLKMDSDSFKYNYLVSNEAEEKNADEFEEKLKKLGEGYEFNARSIEILNETLAHGILPSYFEMPLGFENIRIFKGDTLVFEAINHEDMGVFDFRR